MRFSNTPTHTLALSPVQNVDGLSVGAGVTQDAAGLVDSTKSTPRAQCLQTKLAAV
jgi:hypothetical protein